MEGHTAEERPRDRPDRLDSRTREDLLREPYPVAITPLLPQFLTRRRAAADYPLRAMERLGLDRPSYFFMLDLGIQDPAGARPQDIGNATYRTTDVPIRSTAAAAESAGLITWSDGRWSLTSSGRGALDAFRWAIDAHYASLVPIPLGELEELAGLLDQAYRAAATAADPKTRDHTPRGARYRWQEPTSPMARLDAAIYGLWQVRDDCHVQAWSDAALPGPALDVLTKVWRGEAKTAQELSGAARPEADTRIALQQLRDAGFLAPAQDGTDGPELAVTARGAGARERIEAETDRYFFSPWPDGVGGRAAWIADRLGAVNAALA